MKKFILFLLFISIFASGVYIYYKNTISSDTPVVTNNISQNDGGITETLHPLTIENLRSISTPGSEITIEQTLANGSNYKRYIASYKSEGLKIYGLLTIPNGEPPTGGWPAIIFNHGYIPPKEYRTTEKYIAYTDGFSRNGYVLFRSDYRGHGNSEGEASGAYSSNNYTIDVLNAFNSIKKYPNVNPNKIGFWGHSMGGYITLRSMVVDKSIKAGVIWAGVVGSYQDMLNNWRCPGSTIAPAPSGIRTNWRRDLVEKYGTPESNPEFWNSISANYFLKDIGGPIELHHGTGDSTVPIEFSKTLYKELQDAGIPVNYFEYPGDDHNIARNFSLAMKRSIEFFDKNLKN